MIALLLGLRLAMTVMFLALLLHWVRDPVTTKAVDRLRQAAIALVAGANAIGWGPPRISLLLGHPWPPSAENWFRVGAMMAMIGAAMIWTAMRGLRMGGGRADIWRGVAANMMLVALCVAGAAAIR